MIKKNGPIILPIFSGKYILKQKIRIQQSSIQNKNCESDNSPLQNKIQIIKYYSSNNNNRGIYETKSFNSR